MISPLYSFRQRSHQTYHGCLLHQFLILGVLLRPSDKDHASIVDGGTAWIADQTLEILARGYRVVILHGTLNEPTAGKGRGEVELRRGKKRRLPKCSHS